jgi:transcriptional regulator with XRE-family HTH domain
MNGVKVSPERFKSMREEKGMTARDLAREIGSTGYQMWRLASDRHTTSFRFLDRLVPVFGLQAVVEIIADEGQREAFTLWHTATHEANRTTA